MKLMPLLLAPALIAATGCTQIKVSSYRCPTTDLSRISTYMWVDAPAEIMNKETTWHDRALQQALNSELAALGWNEVLEASNATVLVSYYVDIDSHREYAEMAPQRQSDFAGGLVLDTETDNWRYEAHPADRIEYSIDTGTLVCSLRDPASGEVVWKGKARAAIDRSLAEEKLEEQYRRFAHALLSALKKDIDRR